MAIQYSGNTQTSTFSPTSKQDIINAVGAALVTAGWTTVSGGTGTTAWKLQSAATPQGYAIRVLMRDNGGSCVTFSLESSDGTLAGGNSTTVGCFLIPGGYTYKMVLCKYQAFIYVVPYTFASRTAVAFGIPYVPAWVTGGTSKLAWMWANSFQDGDATTLYGWRDCLTTPNGQDGYNAQQSLYNSTLWTLNSAPLAGSIRIAAFWSFDGSSASNAYRWQSNAALLFDALIAWGDTSSGAEAKFKGQLWDACCSSDAYAADTSSTFDTHNWTTMQGAANPSRFQQGTLLLATS